MEQELYLGNLNALRDWGHAEDYVEAMWLMLQQPKPEDFVIATGITTSVRDFVKMAFHEAGIEIEFKGEGVNEKGFIKSCSGEYKLPVGKEVVSVDPKYFRPTEVELLLGDPSKAKQKLGWKPKHDLKSLVKDMMSSDLKLFKRDKYLLEGGHKVLHYHE
jgi:GDPmannose 4,6-dehydratase